ncbi:kinase binding protein CGI-121-domain-containing protein [Xylaria intraflava]|nr:kinase binding protein CGI-121-domain-containing protein [Xylaria intraflava]
MGPDIQDSPDQEENTLTPRAKRLKVQHQTHHTTTAEANPQLLPTTAMPSILETIQLEHVPSTHSVHVAVFRNVENAAFLHQQLLARNAEFQYALIDAGVITSRLQVLGAAFKAITVQAAGTMKTPNVHSEIVCSLSPANNIAEAYRRHGITPTSRDLVIVKVLIRTPEDTTPGPESETTASSTGKPALTAQDIEKHLLTHVKGDPAPFTDETLSELTDWGRVRKYYKLNGLGWLDGLKDPAAKNREINMLAVGGMALRGV